MSKTSVLNCRFFFYCPFKRNFILFLIAMQYHGSAFDVFKKSNYLSNENTLKSVYNI